LLLVNIGLLKQDALNAPLVAPIAPINIVKDLRKISKIFDIVQLESIRHRSPTVIEEKDINQPTNHRIFSSP